MDIKHLKKVLDLYPEETKVAIVLNPDWEIVDSEPITALTFWHDSRGSGVLYLKTTSPHFLPQEKGGDEVDKKSQNCSRSPEVT